MTSVRVVPGELRPGALRAPPSKSDALRRLAVGYALGAQAPASDAHPDETPEDILVLQRGLAQLRSPGAVIDAHDGAAPLRFLLALAAVTPGADVTIVGSARLGERPHAPLLQSLRDALGAYGARIDEGTPWPLRVRGIRREPAPRDVVFRAPVDRSSQFASALLFAAAALSRRTGQPCRVEWSGEVTSAGYLDLSCAWLTAAGVTLARSAAGAEVDASAARAKLPGVPADWSSLAYLLLAGWKLGVPVLGADLSAPHPDRAIVAHLRDCGLTVEHDEASRTTRVSGQPRRGLVASARDTPDLIPTLAALAAVLPEPSVFRDVSVLRIKESDRVEGIREMLTAFGGETTLDGDALHVAPMRELRPEVRWSAAGDHRRAMTAAVLAVLTGREVVIDGAECVRKSFPAFFDVLGIRSGQR